MQQKKEREQNKMGCLTFLLILTIGVILWVGISYGLALITLWISNGLFNYSLDDKFVYVLVAWLVLTLIFGKR